MTYRGHIQGNVVILETPTDLPDGTLVIIEPAPVQAGCDDGDADIRRRALDAIGKFRAGRGDLSARHDAHLTEAFGEGLALLTRLPFWPVLSLTTPTAPKRGPQEPVARLPRRSAHDTLNMSLNDDAIFWKGENANGQDTRRQDIL